MPFFSMVSYERGYKTPALSKKWTKSKNPYFFYSQITGCKFLGKKQSFFIIICLENAKHLGLFYQARKRYNENGIKNFIYINATFISLPIFYGMYQIGFSNVQNLLKLTESTGFRPKRAKNLLKLTELTESTIPSCLAMK